MHLTFMGAKVLNIIEYHKYFLYFLLFYCFFRTFVQQINCK